MKKNRVIPVLLLKNGYLVKSKNFTRYQNLGNPVTAVKRLSEWASDELIYLDITREGEYDFMRDDIAYQKRKNVIDIIKDVSKMTFMPIAVGGRIKNINDIALRLESGADKVIVNSILFDNPGFLDQAAKTFGSQCMVVSVDYKIIDNKAYIFSHRDREIKYIAVIDWVKEMISRGAGEIMLHSVDKDGAQNGYDIDTIGTISEEIKVPLIACGGAGNWQHMVHALKNTNVDAVAAANVFHYTDQSVYMAKKYLFENGCNVRNPEILRIKEKFYEVL